jgi:ryanodine receptor 2
MSYQPKPVDTSHVDLGPVAGLTEFLAEQTHEIWAANRMAEGWTYGPRRDDKLKQTPDMIPYTQLSEGERDYDRKISAHTLKLILAQGYKLSPPEKRSRAFAGQGPLSADLDDMNDKGEIEWLESRLAAEPSLEPLIDRLRWLDKELGPGFHEVDESANRNQLCYLRASLWCLICAGLAVFLAVYQLADFPKFGLPSLALPVAEFVLVAGAVLLVLLDFQKKWRETWLTDRSRAERIRALKFRSLLNPGFWSEVTRPQAEAEIRGDLRKINSLTPERLENHLAYANLDPSVPSVISGTPELDHAIGNYYLRRRLIIQSGYVRQKVRTYHHADQRTKLLGTCLFFGVLLFVFAHDAVDLVSHLSHVEPAAAGHPVDNWPATVGRVLIFFAAILPLGSATLHVYRSGREAGRNHLRSAATYKRLSSLRTRLEKSEHNHEQIRLMVQSEVVLANEHEQWLQLMKECEWYG